jgi:hypothetical protein
VIHCVGNKDGALLIYDDSRGEVQASLSCGPSVPTIPLLHSRTIDEIPNRPAQIRLLRILLRGSLARLGKGILVRRLSCLRFMLNSRPRAFLACYPSDRRDDTGRSINPPNDVIFRVGDIHIAVRIDRQSLWFIQARLTGRAAVS